MESYGLDSGTLSAIREDSSENASSQIEAGTQLQATVSTKSVHEENKFLSTSVQWRGDSFQKEIDKWKEFYDDMKTYLSDGTLPLRNQTNILKQAETFSLGPNGHLYYTKTLKDSPVTLKLPVVRSYEERMQVCKAIHLSTGEDNIHHRRDTMLELLGQQYYWKGQRRDVCQCIASCEMCSMGLGAKRRAKPPGQKRDIRPPQKLLRVGNSLLPFTSITPVTNPPTIPYPSPQGNQKDKEKSLCSSATDKTTHTSHSHLFTDSTAGTVQHSFSQVPNASTPAPSLPVVHTVEHTAPSSTPVEPLTNLYTIANACVSTDTRLDNATPSGKESHTNTEMSVGSEVMISDGSGLQIFTTINEPCEPEEMGRNDCPTILSACDDNSEATSGSSDEDDDQYLAQLSPPTHDVTVSEPSIYQLLFQLPSVPNTSLCGAVIESMQMSLKSTADSVQLAHVSSQSLLSALKLPTSTLVALVSPSRAAAYITSLAAILTKQNLLCINSQIIQINPAPPVILHDTCCEAGSPKLCSSLVGACNWNMGTHTNPMDQEILRMAISSNRVVAILHRPYIYPRSSRFLPLDAISSISHAANSHIGLIVDCAGMTGNSLADLTSTLQEIITKGADLIMLPNTDYFQGPPHTCVLVGRAALLAGMWDQLSLLQRQLGLPLLCSAYDTVGSVVAFKSLQVASFKEEPSNEHY